MVDKTIIFKEVEITSDVLSSIDQIQESKNLAMVKENGIFIKGIQNPSEAVQLKAVNKAPHAIQYIDNPSEMVQLGALNQDPYAIRLIEDPTKKILEFAIKSRREKINELRAMDLKNLTIQFLETKNYFLNKKLVKHLKSEQQLSLIGQKLIELKFINQSTLRAIQKQIII